MIPRVQTARNACCPGDLRLVGRRSRGAPRRARGGAASRAAEQGPAGAPPPGARRPAAIFVCAQPVEIPQNAEI